MAMVSDHGTITQPAPPQPWQTMVAGGMAVLEALPA